MSNGSDSDASATGSPSVPGLEYDFEGKSVLDILRDLYHVPVLLAVFATMLWIRLQSYDRFTQGGEIYFSGNDAWYHLRETIYAVQHWPFTMPFDPWTNFPTGTASGGQFGSLFDQLVALAALILGLGDPSSELIARTLLVSPAVFGALTVIPAYLIGKRLGGRIGGLFASVVLLLLPGTFLRRTLVGFADHNGAEPFFQGLAVVAIMVALAVAQRDRPIWELVESRDWDALREPAKWSALAGVAMGLYLWVWPPGILLVGVFAVYVTLQSVSDYVGGRSPDHVAFVAIVSMATTLLFAVISFDEASFSPSSISLLHLSFIPTVAVGAAGLAWLARQFDAREFSDDRLTAFGFPVAVSALGAVAILAVVLIPVEPFSTISNNLLRFVGFSAGAASRTIGEAQPFLSSGLSRYYSDTGVVLAEYGFAFVTALLAAVWMLAKPLWQRGEDDDYLLLGGATLLVLFMFVGRGLYNDFAGALGVNPQLLGLAIVGALVFAAVIRVRYDAEHLFAFVWVAFITAAAFTQVRFNYYLAVGVAAFNAYFIAEFLRAIDVDLSRESVPDVETYQLIAVALAVMVVLVPVLMLPLSLGNSGSASIDRTSTAWQTGNSTGPGSVVVWDQSLEWMQNNTPREGTLGGANNGEQLDYYGKYDRPQDGDFDYPDGSYGVQSWWDYGHYITVQGERIPNANPFQQGATEAANYLLAPNESQAEAVLERNSEDDATTRYVMVDWEMVTETSKLSAPAVFYDEGNLSANDLYSRDTPVLRETQRGYGVAFYDHPQRYYDSQMVRLYKYHGSRAEPTVNTGFGEAVIVFDYDPVPQAPDYKAVPQGENATAIRTFPNMTAAEQFVEEDGTAQIGGVGDYPREPVPALQHYRLVDASETSAYASQQYQQSVLRESQSLGLRPGLLQKTSPNWVKTFERVPGATVEGSGADPNETVTATVQMKMAPGENASTFTYEQQTTADENGNFEFALPYSTTGYDEYGPENGYTDVGVRADGPYSVTGEVTSNDSAYLLRDQATLNVSEGDVNGAEDGTASVTLQEEVLQEPGGANESNGNETSGNETAGNETAGNQTAGNETLGNGTASNETGGNESASIAASGPPTHSGASAPAVRAGVRTAARP
ncbi:oligosaccharyl transferase, archaeosortase A system-associated [Halorarum halophilum]|uniref:dolichyl-phosphooligosaccharide-protein glycotransferase n=1 Tax=Halorarum halophilum TaxID=2743090 RepID=A0A7D5KW52_9EURY|nr:oligosaccharyl transferase, archaeosortase A system-associated [Halobaculum halophilum]QLG26098.1 oligosaccharyl transferase, archaeosortase A system-associated [Halobaculum halophilum]